jgi:hypothetical protein
MKIGLKSKRTLVISSDRDRSLITLWQESQLSPLESGEYRCSGPLQLTALGAKRP